MCADNMSNTPSSTLNANGDEQVVGKTSILASVLAVSLLGIPPNLLTILLILRAKQPKSTTTYFLLNLAIADVMNLLISLLRAILKCLPIGHGTKLSIITFTPKTVANVTLAFIALERYNGLVRTMAPFVNMGKGKVKIILGVTWSVSIAYYMSIFAYTMMNDGGTEETLLATFFTVCILVAYVLPLVVVGYCYGKILKGLSQGGTILGQIPANKTAMKEKKHFIRIMVVVAVVFMACNLPAVVVKIMITADLDIVSHELWNTLILLSCVSSAVNPYIYGLRSKRYRKQVKELLCCERQTTT